MKIPGRRDDLQNEALKLVEPRPRAKQSEGTQGNLQVGTEVAQPSADEIQIDIGLGQSIGAVLNPAVMEQERRAKFEDIKARVKNGTYFMPASSEVAAKLSEEIQLEIMSAAGMNK